MLVKEEVILEMENIEYTSGPVDPETQQISFTTSKSKCGEVLVACTGNFTFVCTLCLEEFVELQCFGEHIQSHHMTVRIDSRDVKSSKEDGQDPLDIAAVGEKLMPEYDDICDYRFHSENEQTDDDYEPHESREPILDIFDSSLKFTCDICPRTYSHKRTLLAHKRKVHEIRTTPVQEPTKIILIPDLPVHCDSLHSEDEQIDEEYGPAESGEMPLILDIFDSAEKYTCDRCPRSYSHKRTLLAHRRKVHETKTKSIHEVEDDYELPQSGQKSSIPNIINSEQKFTCDICGVSYSHKRTLVSHIRKVHKNGTMSDDELPESCTPHIIDGEQKYVCDICCSSYSHKRTLLSHRRKIHKKETMPIQKPEENYKSPEAEEQKSQIPDITDSEGKYPCDVCGQRYSHKRTLIWHRRKVHEKRSTLPPKSRKILPVINTPIDQLTCKYCDKKCEDKESLRVHRKTHTGENRFVCKYCDKTFNCRKSRLEHLSVHTGERHFKCPHCPKMFARHANLDIHVRAHLKIKNYSCDYCDKRFVQSSEKKVHEFTHTGETPLQCEQCGKRFSTKNKLTDHLRRHDNIRNYKCVICNKAFYGSAQLKNHMPTHTGEKPFVCNVCGKRFPRKKSLKTHKLLHTGEKKYVCNKCGKAFAQFAGLYSHRKSHSETPIW